MAKTEINYACGHGSHIGNLTGKMTSRDSYVAWAEANKVCPECYKAKKAKEDAEAKKVATLTLAPGAQCSLSLAATGQIEANKEALSAAGYRWSDAVSGVMGYLSARRPARVLCLQSPAITSVEQAQAWITEQSVVMQALGYNISNGVTPLDFAYLAKTIATNTDKAKTKAAAVATLEAIQASDPRPARTPLRLRIAKLESSKKSRWNGKIYGKKGCFNFYVDNIKYLATDAEVAEREVNIVACAAWDKKYAAEIEAAK